jgi:uracil-DNA glycosylase
MVDEPKSLALPQVKAERVARLEENHIAPLTRFVERIRQETGLAKEIPFFDPLDGGILAKCFFLLEAPGPKAVVSGFISRNNPDETAKNFFVLNQLANLPRGKTVSWNIIPWYIGTGKNIRSANQKDIESGLKYLTQLLPFFPHLATLVMVGRKAERAEPILREQFGNIKLVHMLHPSPRVINTNPLNRERILATLKSIAKEL